jgi:hypothetical protein
MEEKKFIIKRSFSDGHQRELIINKNFIKFENKDTTNPFTIFQGYEITDYRFGIRWIRFELTYGREYQIFVRNKNNETIKISFKSYFGRKKNILHRLYINILDELWTAFFSEKVDKYLEKFEKGVEFSIGDVLFNKDYIELHISGIVSQKRIRISWKNVRSRNYFTYFSIYSNENPAEINRGYSYKEDWNTNVLYSVTRTILETKGIEKYK